MKKLFFILTLIVLMLACTTASALTIEYDGYRTEYTGSVYELHVNNEKQTLPLHPIIFNDRALVPVREVFEALGATVTYNENAKSVDVAYAGNSIVLYINNPNAYINGKQVTIPDNAVPKLINIVGQPAKTMVPVRFISESLNMDVAFNDPIINISNKTTSTTTPVPTTTPETNLTGPGKITEITFVASENGVFNSKIKIDGGFEKINAFILTNPTRLVVDVYNCNYTTASSFSTGLTSISKIRLGYESGRSRIVFDAANISSANILYSSTELVIDIGTIGAQTTSVSVNKNTSQTTPTTSPEATPTTPPTQSQDTPSIHNPNYTEFKNSDKLIVIDAGHGGKDGGATGTLNDKTVLEKTLTLQIAQKTAEILTNKGYNVKLTRETDIYPTLTERAEIANYSNAAIFISIHINSAASAPSASGTETYYASLNNDTSYGLKSSALASAIHKYMVSHLGAKDRGVKQANHVVTRTSLMPAALVEVGFISNTTELSKMVSSDYQLKVAEAISSGIIDSITNVTIPDNRQELFEKRLIALNEWENVQ